MGTWGSNLYANDLTSDVRDVYMGFIKEQLSNQDSYEKTLETFVECIGDEDEEPLFWFALADTQWKIGRLNPVVKTNYFQKWQGIGYEAEELVEVFHLNLNR